MFILLLQYIYDSSLKKAPVDLFLEIDLKVSTEAQQLTERISDNVCCVVYNSTSSALRALILMSGIAVAAPHSHRTRQQKRKQHVNALPFLLFLNQRVSLKLFIFECVVCELAHCQTSFKMSVVQGSSIEFETVRILDIALGANIVRP